MHYPNIFERKRLGILHTRDYLEENYFYPKSKILNLTTKMFIWNNPYFRTI